MNLDPDPSRTQHAPAAPSDSPFAQPARSRTHARLELGIPGFSYADLHDPLRLPALTAAFDAALEASDAELFSRYRDHRAGAARQEGPAESALLIELAGHVSRFVGQLFGVSSQLQVLRDAAGRDVPLFRIKRDFVQRRVFKKGAERTKAEEFPALDAQVQVLLEAASLLDARARDAKGDEELLCAMVIEVLLDGERVMSQRLDPRKPSALYAPDLHRFRSLASALGAGLRASSGPAVAAVLSAFPLLLAEQNTDEEPSQDELALARQLLALFERFLSGLGVHPDGRARAHHWSLLRLAHPTDFANLVPLGHKHAHGAELLIGEDEHQRRRDGFKLTDPRAGSRAVRSEIDYCIYCHERERDSCSSGFKEKRDENPKAPLTGRLIDERAPFKKNPLGIALTGCPLEERIGEMHKVGGGGDPLGALALDLIDNPMLPGTGHRICNDCMKACVYQKQQPVDIPQIETRMLSDVLKLQWGFEIAACSPAGIRSPSGPDSGKKRGRTPG